MKIPLFLTFSFIACSIFAQNNPYAPPPVATNVPDVYGAKYFHFGLNVTPGIYWVSPNSSNNSANGSSFGFSYGANLEFYFTRNYGFLLGFSIANLGAKYVNTNANPSANTADSTIYHNESVQYLEIPLMLKMKTNPFGRMRYYGVVGLQAGFLLKATDDYNSTVEVYIPTVPPLPSPTNTYTYSGNNENIYKQSDFFRVSLVFGIGAEYTLAGSTALQACISYNNCFTNMNSSSNNAVNLKGIELMIGLLF